MHQLLQIAGALAILAAFALVQLRVLDQHARSYLALNLVGSALLAALAHAERQWGFLLLEGVWALLSAWSLARAPRRGADVSGERKAGTYGTNATERMT